MDDSRIKSLEQRGFYLLSYGLGGAALLVLCLVITLWAGVIIASVGETIIAIGFLVNRRELRRLRRIGATARAD